MVRYLENILLIAGSVATMVAGFAFGPVLESGGLSALFWLLAVQMTVAGMVYGPLGAWMSAAFPVNVRYTGISIGFNCGGVIGGALVFPSIFHMSKGYYR